jgi:HTH-type transcriptional regulator/antitoxin HigA
MSTVAIDPVRYKRLLSRAMPRVIETEEENDRMLAEVELLMVKGENLSPEEDALLRLMATLIQDFEESFYKPEEATPLEVLHHLMDARSISKAQAKALAHFFGVSPELFI